MRSIILSMAVLCSTLPAMLLSASAQQPAVTAPPPPQMENLDEGDTPAITIRKPGEGEKRITEKRERGRVTEVRVQTGGSTYYLKPNDQAGSALPGDAEASLMRAPQWEVMEFDLKRPDQPTANGDRQEKSMPAAPEKPAAQKTK